MKNYFILIILLVSNAFSQKNLQWQGYFSYNETVDISASNDKIVAASQNALFSKNLTNGEIQTFNTIDGLSGEDISAIYFSVAFNKTLIGYKNGLLIVINESDKKVSKIVGIIQKQLPSNIKFINNFYENGNFVYVSCGFGIMKFNLANQEFGDTYFLGSTINDYQEVIQTTVFENSIYAVTRNNGIKKGDLNNKNLNDFSQWQIFDVGFWNGIATLNNQLIASNNNNILYKFTDIGSTMFFISNDVTKRFKVYNNFLTVVNNSKIIVFNDILSPILQISNSSLPVVPIPAFNGASFTDGKLFIGTKENGVFSTTLQNSNNFENITPNCPIRNKIFSLDASTDNLWAVYGGFSEDYNPYEYAPGGPNEYGFSKFNKNGWQNTPYLGTLNAKALSRIIINPNNPNEMYFSSYFSGLLKLENGVATKLFNLSNSGIESIYNDQIRLYGFAFDKTGNLWFNTTRFKKGLQVFKKDNTWQTINLETILAPNNINSCDFGNIIIDKNNTKWIATDNNGVIAYNEKGNVFKKITEGVDSGNLPFADVNVIALDNKNQLWIGTARGLRVLSSIDNFLQPGQMKSNSIIILEDDLAQELFYEQPITDIYVDGANRKWVGTADSGIYLVSPNGQQTIYQFTINNSPLPSNTIIDIEINPKTGEVFIATDKGMISFKGTATKATENLEEVFIYPNPVRPDFIDTVKISGLLDKANVKITDIEGSLVHEATSEGGTIEWDTTAFGKYKVATGVYMVFIAAADGGETKVKKVMIVR